MSYLQEMQKAGVININQTKPIVKEMTPIEITNTLIEQKAMFQRVIQNNKNRIKDIEKEVGELASKLKEATEFINKIKDREIVEKTREKLYSMRDKKPMDKPIDRNNVAPKDVDIQKIFYAGGR
ncbi:MAG: hypothetical protein ACMXX6_01065 [Candidatus Woesearchaeota archaeon]